MKPRPHVLSLFSGIGGLELGLERAGMTTVGQVEIDPFCRKVLEKHWPEVPKHDDVRTAVEWWQSQRRPRVDVVCGGFPCQDISNNGNQVGITGPRSGLWSYMANTIRGIRPRYVVMENVAALVVRGLDVVAGDLAEIGYDLRWDCIPASALCAPHQRDRWFGVAYPTRGRRDERQDGSRAEAAGICAIQQPARGGGGAPFGRGWASEPNVGRVADGIPSRVDRLRALGNAVVPQVAEYVGQLIMAAELEVAS